MNCRIFWKRIVPFVLTLTFGLLAVNILQNKIPANKSQEGIKQAVFVEENEPLQVISKSPAKYTDAARQNQIQGTVTLRVTFSANGEISNVSPVSNLPDGLTEQAISAAYQIRFEPARKKGIPQTVTKLVQYNFTLY